MFYVDPLRPCLKTPNWPYDRSCHMYADSLSELHAAAIAIGLPRTYFRDRLGFPHYDLTRTKRLAAIVRGAQQHTLAELVQHVRASAPP